MVFFRLLSGFHSVNQSFVTKLEAERKGGKVSFSRGVPVEKAVSGRISGLSSFFARFLIC
jgi:hypothetical protein